MNLTDWINLPPDQFAEKLRNAQMSRERYDELVASIEADERKEAEMRAAGTLPTKLPDGKLSDSLSYGVPRVVEEAEQGARERMFVDRVTKDLPPDVPLALRRRLAAHAYSLASAPERAATESDSALAKEARAIARAAKRLTQRLDEWHERAGSIALDTRAADDALAGPLFADGDRLTEEELRHALIGMDRHAIAVSLLGLQVHLSSIASRLSSAGAPHRWRQRALEDLVLSAFDAQEDRAGKARRGSASQARDWWAPAVLREVLAALKEATQADGADTPHDIDRQVKRARKAMRRRGT